MTRPSSAAAAGANPSRQRYTLLYIAVSTVEPSGTLLYDGIVSHSGRKCTVAY